MNGGAGNLTMLLFYIGCPTKITAISCHRGGENPSKISFSVGVPDVYKDLLFKLSYSTSGFLSYGLMS